MRIVDDNVETFFEYIHFITNKYFIINFDISKTVFCAANVKTQIKLHIGPIFCFRSLSQNGSSFLSDLFSAQRFMNVVS